MLGKTAEAREDAEDQRRLLCLYGSFIFLMMNDGGIDKVGCGG